MHAVDILKACLTEEASRNIGESICESAPRTRRAIDLGVALLLCGLGEISAGGQGARAVARLLAEEEPISMDSLPEAMRGSQANMCMERGAGMLVDVLGGDFMEACGTAINRHAGTGVGAAKSLVSLLMPPVLAAVKMSMGPRPADAEGVVSAFESQRVSIAAAFPAGFSLQQAPETRLQRCAEYLRESEPVTESNPAAAEAPKGALKSLLSRLMPIIVIAVLAGIAVERYVTVQQREQRQARVQQPPRSAGDVAADRASLVSARLGPESISPRPVMSSLQMSLDAAASSLAQTKTAGLPGAAAIEMRVEQLRKQRLESQAQSMASWQAQTASLKPAIEELQRQSQDRARQTDNRRLRDALRALDDELSRW